MKLNNFLEENNDIDFFSSVVRIWDFKLYKDNEEKIIDWAKIWYTIYGIDSIENLYKSNKNIIVVIPALTGNSKIFNTSSNQWEWWANKYWKPWNILDPNKNIIIALDYFWWPYDSSWPNKHDLNFYPVPPEKQVEAWKKALLKLGITKIYALFWWSNWWWHIHNWIFEWQYEPEYLIPIAWPIAPTQEAKEFFSLQVDFVKNRNNVSKRLIDNVSDLLWQSELYDLLIRIIIKEIWYIIDNWNNEDAIKIVRKIWFLKFLNPKFFDRFYFDKNWNKLPDIESATKNMVSYFDKEWISFEKRFSLSSLILLSQWLVDAKRISPEEYVENISDKINLIIISIEDDKLFETKPMQKYFSEIKKIRQKRKDKGITKLEIISSTPETLQAWHDTFLWDNSMQIISDKIMKNIIKKTSRLNSLSFRKWMLQYKKKPSPSEEG